MCAAIAQKALKPEQICAVHINNGFLRKNESESTLEALRKLGLNGGLAFIMIEVCALFDVIFLSFH